MSRQGHRSDLELIKTKLDTGVPVDQIADEHFAQWVVYRRSFDAYRQLKLGARRHPPRVEVLWGCTGMGKSQYVFDLCATFNLRVWKHPGESWFDNYNGQEVALFDDFTGEDMLPFTRLLRVLDKFPELVPVKGGYVWFNPKKIFITSNISPRLWYKTINGEQQAALDRRLHRVEYIDYKLY